MNMEPFDIIEQRSSYAELTEQERELIQDCCQNESEFAALKALMMPGELDLTMAPDPSIKSRLDGLFDLQNVPSGQKKILRFWKTYTAIGVAASLALFLVWRSSFDESETKTVKVTQKENPKKKPPVAQTKSDAKKSIVPELVKKSPLPLLAEKEKSRMQVSDDLATTVPAEDFNSTLTYAEVVKLSDDNESSLGTYQWTADVKSSADSKDNLDKSKLAEPVKSAKVEMLESIFALY